MDVDGLVHFFVVKICDGNICNFFVLLEMGRFYRTYAISEKTKTIYSISSAETICRSEFSYRLGRNVCDVVAVTGTGYFNLFVSPEIYCTGNQHYRIKRVNTGQ